MSATFHDKSGDKVLMSCLWQNTEVFFLVLGTESAGPMLNVISRS